MRSLGVSIGSNCDILTRIENFGSEPWLIEIGNHVTIADGVVLITHDGSSRVFRTQIPGMSKFGNKFGTIIVKDNCFIGVNSILLPGITIGPNSIIGVGSIVTKSVPPNSVAVGNPARVLYNLEEYIQRYQDKMINIVSKTRNDLRRELTHKLWGEEW